MKALISTLLFVSLIASHAQAAGQRDSRVSVAASLLADVAESVSPVQLKPAEIKEALKALAAERHGLTDEEFEENWEGAGSGAWDADSAAWGFDTPMGARDYIEGALREQLVQSEQTNEDKTKYADAMLKVDRAFSLISYDTKIQYGVAPLGAIQCGVTFAELIIVDTRTGEGYEVVMEGSGC